MGRGVGYSVPLMHSAHARRHVITRSLHPNWLLHCGDECTLPMVRIGLGLLWCPIRPTRLLLLQSAVMRGVPYMSPVCSATDSHGYAAHWPLPVRLRGCPAGNQLIWRYTWRRPGGRSLANTKEAGSHTLSTLTQFTYLLPYLYVSHAPIGSPSSWRDCRQYSRWLPYSSLAGQECSDSSWYAISRPRGSRYAGGERLGASSGKGGLWACWPCAFF